MKNILYVCFIKCFAKLLLIIIIIICDYEIVELEYYSTFPRFKTKYNVDKMAVRCYIKCISHA